MPNPSQLDPGQIIKRSFDEATDALRVELAAGVASIGSVDIIDGSGGGAKAAVKPASTAAIATDPALVVAISPNSALPSTVVGYTVHEFVRNSYVSTPVTTAAYVQLIASTSNLYQEFEIFDSSGQTLVIAFGGAGVEVDSFLVFPGGNGRVSHKVLAGTRISIKAVSGNAIAGEISINLRG